jgi:hypothetical protein
VAALELLIKALEHAARALAAVARTLEPDLVAALLRHDAETPLDQRKVLPVLAEQRGGAAIVVEGENGFGGRDIARRLGGRDQRSIVGRQIAQ